MDDPIQVPFPRYIDRPKMIGIFEIDEAAVGLIPMVLTALYGFIKGYESSIMLALGFVLWIATGIIVHKFKANNPNGFVFHWFYRMGIYHPIMSNAKIRLRRKDVRGGAKIIPTGIVRTFLN